MEEWTGAQKVLQTWRELRERPEFFGVILKFIAMINNHQRTPYTKNIHEHCKTFVSESSRI
jgi:hypothetical protein